MPEVASLSTLSKVAQVQLIIPSKQRAGGGDERVRDAEAASITFLHRADEPERDDALFLPCHCGKDLEAHYKTCRYSLCPHHNRGCTVRLILDCLDE